MMKARALNLTWMILAGFLALVFFLNWTYVFCSDDCFYGVMWNGSEWQRVGTIWNAFCLQIVERHRPFIHFFNRVFNGCFPKWVFNVCNTAMMGALIFLINRLAVKSWRPRWEAMAALCALTFFVLCKGESCLWGTANYLWTGVMTLAFCLIRERLENDNLSATMIWLLLIPVALFGSANEAFSPSICVALAVTSLINFKQLNWKKLLVYSAYGLGTILLCWVEGQRRSQSIPSPSLTTVALSAVKVVYVCKGVWVLALVFLFCPRKIDFIKRNLFELVSIFSSMVIGVAIGFVGEQVLWIANLMSIVLIVRMVTVTRFWACLGLVALMLATCCIVPLGVRIRHNYDSLLSSYSTSQDNIVCQDYVSCGIFGRYFFQCIYGWQAMGYHPNVFSLYYGRPRVCPLGLTRSLYDKVYLSDAFRRDYAKLPLPFDAFELPGDNTIVIPIAPGSELDKPFNEVSVTYAPPGSAFERVRAYVEGLGRPVLPFPDFPVRLKTKWGEVWLVARKPSPTLHVTDISLKTTDRKHPDDGAWWCEEKMKMLPILKVKK